MITIIPIRAVNELEALFHQSSQKPIIIFKHSATCPVSAAAKREVDAWAFEAGEHDPAVFQVIVQEAREASNQIAARLNVVHQSPQIILVKDGRSCGDFSHSAITRQNLRQAVDKLHG